MDGPFAGMEGGGLRGGDGQLTWLKVFDSAFFLYRLGPSSWTMAPSHSICNHYCPLNALLPYKPFRL